MVNDPPLQPVVRQADQIEYYEGSEPASMNLDELVQVCLRRRWLLLGCMALVFVLGMLYIIFRPRVYQSTASILVTASKPVRGDDLPLLSDLEALTQARSVDTQMSIISSDGLLREAFAGLTPAERETGFRSLTIPRWAVNISTKKNTDVINITVRAYTPMVAALLANRIADTFFDRDLQKNKAATRRARAYVETRLADERRQLAAANTELARLKEHTGLVAPSDQVTKVAESVAMLQVELDRAQAEARATHQALGIMQREIAGMQGTVVSQTTIGQNPSFNAARERIDALFAERARLLQEYQSTADEVKAVEARIEAEQAQLSKITANVVASETSARNPVRDDLQRSYALNVAADASSSARIRSLEQAIAARRRELQHLPEQVRRLTDLMMQVDAKKQIVEMLTQKSLTLLISEEATLPNGRLISQALPESKPVAPRLKVSLLLFLVLGIVAGLVLVLLVERVDDRIHDQVTAEEITALPTMGTIHEVSAGESKIIEGKDDGLLLECFRVLRNNIVFSSSERHLKLLAITSAEPSEGKSSCCANLAIATALDKKRVLVVDCDFHRPSLHKVFAVPLSIGLTDVVLGECTLDAAVVGTGFAGLSFLPAGTRSSNLTELLNAGYTRQFFLDLAEDYDLVLLDCPPCTRLSDVQVISTIVDGMLLLLATNRTHKQSFQFAYEALSRIAAPLIGLIVNRIDLSRNKYGYLAYYQKYSEDAPQARKQLHNRAE
ncbi:MAG: GumC family protein [Armatimonadota bacterium]